MDLGELNQFSLEIIKYVTSFLEVSEEDLSSYLKGISLDNKEVFKMIQEESYYNVYGSLLKNASPFIIKNIEDIEKTYNSKKLGKIIYYLTYFEDHFSELYFAALIEKDEENRSSILKHLKETRHLTIFNPSVYQSVLEFKILDDYSCIFGLNQIKFLSISDRKNILKVRDENPILDIFLFEEKTKLEQEKIENLIKVGFFSDFGSVNDVMSKYLDSKKSDWLETEQQFVHFSENQIATFEIEFLGFQIHGDESLIFRDTILAKSNIDYDGFVNEDDGYVCIVGGKIVDKRDHIDKNQNQMCFFEIEFEASLWSIVVFASIYTKFRDKIEIGNNVLIKGKKSKESILMDGFVLLEDVLKNTKGRDEDKART